VLEWVRAECRRAPRLIVVEDLQWLDASSEELLRHLAAAAPELPLLLLLNSRLALAGTPLELAGVREVPLRALSPADLTALVDAQLDPYPASPRLARVVTERSAGNPFFLEELIRGFRDQGQLLLEHGTYQLREGAETLVPASVSALIASRLDRLTPSAREAVIDAAVLGMQFPLAHLRAMARSDTLDEDLATIERRGFLDRQATGSVAVLAFRHVLTHEVAYGSLLAPDRHHRHRRAAETLEGLYRGREHEVCDQLAHHWVLSDQRARAYPYLLRAADEAVAMGASHEAIRHLEEALALAGAAPALASPDETRHLRLKLAGLHFIVGER
jgi:predicted ATPase